MKFEKVSRQESDRLIVIDFQIIMINMHTWYEHTYWSVC